MSNSRELSKIFTADTVVATESDVLNVVSSASTEVLQQAILYTDNTTPDLTPAIQAASAAAVAYTDQEIAAIDLTSTIVTASAAAAAYTDSELSTIDLTSTIVTASAAAATYTDNEIANLINSAPETLDTLNELSAALNDDPNFYTTIQSVYLSQSSASSTYLTQLDASENYLTQSNATNNYLTISNASNVYLSQESASIQYEKNIPYSSSTPESPNQGDLWVDSSATPPALKVYDGTNWVQLGAAVDDSQAIIAGRMFA